MKLVDPETWALFELFDWAEDRILPETGGVNDQTSSFLHALRLYRSLKDADEVERARKRAGR